MKFGESSPEGNPLSQLSDCKEARYIAHKYREEFLAAERALRTLHEKLGLAPSQTLEDYFGKYDEALSAQVGGATEQLFEDVFSVLTGEKSVQEFPNGLGAPRPK